MRCLNLGCGRRCHPEWINMDMNPNLPGVIVHDVTQRIPLEDSSCDVVYHSHLLEHIWHPAALPFMRECCRVLRPGGILRVAVPDLEQICCLYLEKMAKAHTGDSHAGLDYEWIIIEMFDQAVREQAGGEMLTYLSRDPIPNEAFVCSRIGEEGRELIRYLRSSKSGGNPPSIPIRPLWKKGLSSFAQCFRKAGRTGLTLMRGLCLGEKERRAMEIGLFRLSGEAHQWMYDRYSLGCLMRAAGFDRPLVLSAAESQVPNWSSYGLDTLEDGTVIKPDSLFMEGTKPANEKGGR
jgi:predicted SAM-dependent methyltransferase